MREDIWREKGVQSLLTASRHWLDVDLLKMNVKTKSYITITRLRTHNLVHIFETYSRMNEKKKRNKLSLDRLG